MNIKLQWVVSRIMKKVCKGFYGSITINFQDGIVQHVSWVETEKPPIDK